MTERTGDASRSDVSVIICAYSERRWDCLVEAVNSLEAQTVLPLEVIVVIDYNESLHDRSLRELPGVRVINNVGERGAGGARNTGVQCARGSVVAFLDDDATAIESWIQIVVERMSASDLLGVGGDVHPRWMAGKPPWFPDEFGWVVGCSYRGLPTVPAPIRNLMACNMAVDRETFLELGGFRRGHGNVQSDTRSGEARRARFVTRQSGCEETDFCIRALARLPGRRWLYEPAMQITHRVPTERGRWAYFLARCHDEGLAKATVVVEFSGAAAGLETERAYVSRTLPAGIARGLLVSMRGDVWGVARAGAIVIGLMVTGAGYVRGRAQTKVRRLFGDRRPDLVESELGRL